MGQTAVGFCRPWLKPSTCACLLVLTWAVTIQTLDPSALTTARYDLREAGIPELQRPRFVARGFVRVYGNAFVDDNCQEFIPTGWNLWGSPIIEQTQAALYEAETNANERPYELLVDTLFNGANEFGMNTMRMFGVGVPGKHILQKAPGVYDEDVFTAFDYILYKAAKYNVKVIWSFTTHWQDNDGPGAYLEWCNICSTWNPNTKCQNDHYDLFWSHPCTIDLFQKHMYNVVNRYNPYTKRLYKDDPVFLGWNLYNEPRCPRSQDPSKTAYCFPALMQWTAVMSQYLKTIDPNHLVSWGHEGFFNYTSTYADFANPFGTPRNVQPGWSGFVGQDFEGQTAVPWVDFGTFHMWPDNWASTDPNYAIDWVNKWMDAHNSASRTMGKPAIIEEFGKRSMPWDTAWLRDPYYNAVYSYVEKSVSNNEWIKGDLFWNWDPYQQQQITWGNAVPPVPGMLPPAANAVRNTDTTFKVVRTHTAVLSYANGRDYSGFGCKKVNSNN